MEHLIRRLATQPDYIKEMATSETFTDNIISTQYMEENMYIDTGYTENENGDITLQESNTFLCGNKLNSELLQVIASSTDLDFSIGKNQ